jgi:hypothetical protein
MGPDDPSVYRATNLQTTAERLFFPTPPAQRGGQPNGISHPMVSMISSRSKHPAVQFVTMRLRQQLRNQMHIVE